ncbi:mannose-6-phosphate isomerase [Thermus composti]|uniref:Class I mannose-6-phosphate isomerase n=1 Tax=Thermus composti TaxID=532059 RepID=A0ABV6Q3N7_9DEIN|nr:class I mannose-6-phosphate isomerase [Thermus composti]GGN03327.1 mannose-6-phosphate isomerase [Thermus composti]
MRRFTPKPVERIWGGSALGFGPGVGEVWLAEEPLLVKLLDPMDWLSVQVHPPHAYALKVEGKPGKYEAWYVLSPGEIVYGFRRPVSKEEVRERAQAGTLDEVLNRVRVAPGQVVYLPAGTVHALGPGVRVYEVQTPSDLTYRLYDYGRPRELHLEKALEVAILKPTPIPPVAPKPVPGGERLLETPYFRLYRYPLRGSLSLRPERPLLLTLLEGEAFLGGEALRPPATFLLEAGEEALLRGEGLLLGAEPALDPASWERGD